MFFNALVDLHSKKKLKEGDSFGTLISCCMVKSRDNWLIYHGTLNICILESYKFPPVPKTDKGRPAFADFYKPVQYNHFAHVLIYGNSDNCMCTQNFQVEHHLLLIPGYGKT